MMLVWRKGNINRTVSLVPYCHYNGAQWYEQFLQVGRLDCDLTLLGFATYTSYHHGRRSENHRLFVRYVSSRLRVNSAMYGISAKNIHRLQRMQNTLARVVLGSSASKFSHSTDMLRHLHWLPYLLNTELNLSLQNYFLILAITVLHSI